MLLWPTWKVTSETSASTIAIRPSTVTDPRSTEVVLMWVRARHSSAEQISPTQIRNSEVRASSVQKPKAPSASPWLARVSTSAVSSTMSTTPSTARGAQKSGRYSAGPSTGGAALMTGGAARRVPA